MRARCHSGPFPHVPSLCAFPMSLGRRMLVVPVLSCPDPLCTDHPGVWVILGLIPSTLDLFSIGKGDPGLFSVGVF